MFGWGSSGGGFMPNALGNNNLQQWGMGAPGFVSGGGVGQSPSWQQPQPFSYDSTDGGMNYRPAAHRSWIRPPAPTPSTSPQPSTPSPSGFAAGQSAPQPTPQTSSQPQANVQPAPGGGFVSGGNAAGAGSVDMLQKNRLGAPSLGNAYGGGAGWTF